MNANVRTDMLRQGTIPANSSLLAHNTTFMQNPSQSGQQPLSQGHMGLPPAAANANQSMAMNPQNAARFLSMQQANSLQPQQQQSRMMARQGVPSGQHIISSGAPHLSAIGPNQLFPPGGMQSAAPNLGARRGPPQPQPGGTAGHLAGLPPNSMTMTMNPQNPIQNHHLRPVQQQPAQRMQPPMSGVPSEMAMAMARQGNNSNGLPQNMSRTAPTIGALNQPPQVGQVAFSPGMQTPHPQNSLQNSAQIPNQLPISSPRPGSHPQANVAMSTAGPSQAPINRAQMTPDNPVFGMGFPPFSQGPSGSRIPNNGQFPFASSNSPVQISDMPTNMSGSIINTTGGTPTRATFQPTPAQQLEQMGGSQDSFNSPFSVQPPRPPSQHNLHSSLSQQHPAFQPPLHRQSPHPSDSLVPHPQRPASQPQPQQLMPGRPPSQLGSHAPSQASINVNANTSTRIPAASSGTQPHPSMGTAPVNIAPRPAQQPIALPGGPAGSVPPLPPSDASSGAMSVLPPQANSIPQVGYGQGLQRLLQFSGLLANDSAKKLQLSWWEECIREYFTPSAIMKITLWKDNQRTEAKPFEIGVPILPRFFLVTTQSGVNSMTLALDGARERPYRNPHHCVIECPSAVWTYKYNSGYTVILRGPLTAHIAVSQLALSAPDSSVLQGGQRHLKFENLQFDADHHDKYILLDTVMHSRISESPVARNDTIPTMNGMAMLQQDDERKWEEPRIMIERSLIPGEPVNAFGIPQATMRCLELAESVGQMSDLIAYSTENKLGPLEALKKFAAHIRESQNYGLFNSVLSTGNTTSNSPNAFTIVTSNPNGPSTMMTGGTLYSSAPPSITNPQVNSTISAPNMNSPQNTPSSASNSPQKQYKTIPQLQSQGAPPSSSGPAASPTVSSGNTNNTPTLKRKQTEVTSPTTSNSEQPPPKRSQRKRRPTAGG